MKKYYIIYLIGILVLFSCQEEYLEKAPLTAVSPETFFKKANDFKIYLNQFYDGLGDRNFGLVNANDWGTDNNILIEPDTHLNGEEIKDVTDNNWNTAYSTIRNINILLENTGDVPFEEIDLYLGEARYFRAWTYFGLLQRFGGVPWISESLDPTEREKLKTPRAPRNVLADSILADLDFAIEHLPPFPKAEPLRLNREAALAFKSRLCLYEGTWEKYHGKAGTPFRVGGSEGTKYLQMAADAALQVINSGYFSIYQEGDESYFNLFNREDFSDNPEVILWRKNGRDLRPNDVSGIISGGIATGGLTRDFIEDYLATDGRPMSLTSLPLADDSLTLVIQNRDPRFAQTIFYPGVIELMSDTREVKKIYTRPDLTRAITGYHYRKGASQLESNNRTHSSQVAFIYFRYGEVLLNYIEAKAELAESGDATLTQNDFDISINKLRDRVGMPHFNFNIPIIDTDDPFAGELPWYIIEIRRERRIELVTEGFRWHDIFRWAAVDKLLKGRIFQGAPFQWYLDNGWYEEGQITYVDDEGYLSPWYGLAIDQQGGYGFVLGRDYLYPLPSQEQVLAGYESNPGWE